MPMLNGLRRRRLIQVMRGTASRSQIERTPHQAGFSIKLGRLLCRYFLVLIQDDRLRITLRHSLIDNNLADVLH